MIRNHKRRDYDTVSRSRHGRSDSSLNPARALRSTSAALESAPPIRTDAPARTLSETDPTFLRRGHTLSFVALFLFTTILYARPAEIYPSALTNSLALAFGITTLLVFAITQFTLEGTPTARPREVNLVLLFVVTAFLSIPLAIDPRIAWGEFSATFVRGVLIFIVIVNVVRTEIRLKLLLFLAITTAIALSAGAINDYRLGLLTIEGYRAAGHGTGIFGNTNDMALHLVTMVPISIALFFGSRRIAGKIIHAVCAAIITSAVLLSYSRGAFLGLWVVLVFFSFKLAPRSRAGMVLLIVTAAATIMLLAPSGFGGRLLSIVVPGLDPGGSADARRGELIRSAYVALRHPFFGIGMGNYQPLMSLKGLVTHNSYTQVAAEMGMTALVFYTMFIVSPLRKLSVIGRETFAARKTSTFYYLALGLQGALLAYMVSSFFLSVAYSWYVYYLVGYAVCFRRMYESDTRRVIVAEKQRDRRARETHELPPAEIGAAAA